MVLSDDKKTQKNATLKTIKQHITMENRERLKVTGVNDVESFNEDIIIVSTELGKLIIKGSNLKVNNLSLENSELLIEGLINYIEYTNKRNKRSLLKRGLKCLSLM